MSNKENDKTYQLLGMGRVNTKGQKHAQKILGDDQLVVQIFIGANHEDPQSPITVSLNWRRGFREWMEDITPEARAEIQGMLVDSLRASLGLPVDGTVVKDEEIPFTSTRELRTQSKEQH